MLVSTNAQGSDLLLTTTDEDNQDAPFIFARIAGDYSECVDDCVSREDIYHIIGVIRGTDSQIPSFDYDLNGDNNQHCRC